MTLPRSRPTRRTTNRERILRAVLRDGAMARVELAARTGLTAAAITNITRELIGAGLLVEVGRQRGDRAGADAILLDLPAKAPLIGVVHQGVTSLRIGLCNLRGQLLARREIATPHPYSPEEAAEIVATTLARLLAEGGHGPEMLLALGAGVVGLVDSERGIVKRAPRLEWEQAPLGELLAARLGCPVLLDNNVRAMAVGEALLGEGRFWPDFAFVYIGTGIGAGLVLNGAAYRGAYGGAGELGHITVDPEGERCSCGNRGCLQTMASEAAMLARARERGVALPAESEAGPKEAMRALVARAEDGDAEARAAVLACGESLGIALADLVTLFNPARIVVHGIVAEAGAEFFEVVARQLHERAFLASGEAVELDSPTFGEDAGLVGAAALALDTWIFPNGGALPTTEPSIAAVARGNERAREVQA